MRTAILLLLLPLVGIGQQYIYISQQIPSFSYLSNNSFCYSEESLALFNDTTLEFTLTPNSQSGYLYYAFSSVGGNVSSVEYLQYDGELVAISPYVFEGYDTLRVAIRITANSIEIFCPFFVPITPLPVTWGSVGIKYENGNVAAYCNTLSESNTNKLCLEISSDLINWNQIDEAAMIGNSSIGNKYSFYAKHELPKSVVYYARFKQTDFNGESSYSEIVSFVAYIALNKPFLNGYDLSGRLFSR